MNKQHLSPVYDFFAVVSVFLIVSLFLTYNVLYLPSLVIGDHFYWTNPNIVDVLGIRVVRESFLGDIGVISTFKSGFLLPVTYVFDGLSIPMTLLYPFLFYFLSMISFYALSAEILNDKALRAIVSVIYVINPVTPYYFASILSVFALTFLPLAMKFFIRTLRELDQTSRQGVFLRSFALSAVFSALSVSAHEQFFLSIALIVLYMMLTFAVVCYRRCGRTWGFMRLVVLNILSFTLIFVTVNAPLLVSLSNTGNAPLSTYFSGRFNDFLANVRYTYANANPITLLRFGGDSGVGLGQDSWYDSGAYTNIFGYTVFILFVVSVLLFARDKKMEKALKAFLWMNALLFIGCLFLILFIETLPNNPALAERIFSFLLQTWQSPIRLRVLLLLSSLTTVLYVFKRLEAFKNIRTSRLLRSTVVMTLIVSTVIYNSPWVVSYAGYTPMQQISDYSKWGKLFDNSYSNLSTLLAENYTDGRGLLIPCTQKAELYVPPGFRLFQLISPVNDQTSKLTEAGDVPWSKVLGLLSAKYVIIDKHYSLNDVLMFPKPFDGNITNVVEEMHSDSGFEFREQLDSYTVLENNNVLPELYATSYFVFYDDTTTLKYASERIDFRKLPVFIGPGGRINEFSIPQVVSDGVYEVNALAPQSYESASSLNLIVANAGDTRGLTLNRVQSIDSMPVFSALCGLSPGDVVKIPNGDTWNDALQLYETVLDSTLYSLGSYDSFMLNFTVAILRPGSYSFLAPRVLVDVGDSKRYIVIFHDNGFVELALLQGEEFISDIMTRYNGYKLNSESDSINVSVIRIFDEIYVYVNNKLAILFPTEPDTSTISLSSEHSMSKFSNINVKTRSILRLFAARQVTTQPAFTVQQNDPNKSVLTVSNNGSQFTVVSQYLYTSLRQLETQPEHVENSEVKANIFFQAWILNTTGSSSKQFLITTNIRSSLMITGFTAASILLTCFILTAQVPLVRKRIFPILRKLLNEFRSKI